MAGSPSDTVNPFLKHDGKDPSKIVCPKAHALKLFVSPVGKPCAACQTQMPNGDRAWRCFSCDFHMCINCMDKGGSYDAPPAEETQGFHNPGWDGTPMDPFGDIEARAIADLQSLLTKYLTKDFGCRLVKVNCETVIPDYSNRYRI